MENYLLSFLFCILLINIAANSRSHVNDDFIKGELLFVRMYVVSLNDAAAAYSGSLFIGLVDTISYSLRYPIFDLLIN